MLLRHATRAALGAGVGAALSRQRVASAAAGSSSTSVHSFTGNLLDGTTMPLASLAGKPALIVNVASE